MSRLHYDLKEVILALVPVAQRCMQPATPPGKWVSTVLRDVLISALRSKSLRGMRVSRMCCLAYATTSKFAQGVSRQNEQGLLSHECVSSHIVF